MSLDLGLLFIRLLFGTAMAAHGAQKLFGWFGGYGLKGTGGYLETLGFRPGTVFAGLAGLSEFVGGLSLALGFFTPFGSAAILAAMLVAAVSVHLKSGFFSQNQGIELPFLYAVAAAGLAFTGPGALSLDVVLGLTFLHDPLVVAGVLALAVAGGAVTLALRRLGHAEESAARG